MLEPKISAFISQSQKRFVFVSYGKFHPYPSHISNNILEATLCSASRSCLDYFCKEAQPKQLISENASRLLAGRAFTRGLQLQKQNVIGVSCTSSLGFTPEEHSVGEQAFISTWSFSGVNSWIVEWKNTVPSKDTERKQSFLNDVVLCAIAQSCEEHPNDFTIPFTQNTSFEDDILGSITVSVQSNNLVQAVQDLHDEKLSFILIHPDGQLTTSNASNGTLLPGSFNPPHQGHWNLLQTAKNKLGSEHSSFYAFELSAFNVDKPPLTVEAVLSRVAPFAGSSAVTVTHAETFIKKCRLFPRSQFVVGFDTAVRILNKKYYGNSDSELDKVIQEIRKLECRFLVAGRILNNVYHPASNIYRAEVLEECGSSMPSCEWKDLFVAIPGELFRADISSTELRQVGALAFRS